MRQNLILPDYIELSLFYNLFYNIHRFYAFSRKSWRRDQSLQEAVAMVKGIGIDIVEIERIASMVRKYGDQFLRKVFTDAEIHYCTGKAFPALHFSGRWAAKEAFFKALPGACQALSGWKSVEVLPGDKDHDKPILSLCSPALSAEMNKNCIESIMVSISHEKTMCVAFVVLTG
jgi:holo-[acyl-carrier protein] synthase